MTHLDPASPTILRCRACGTLVDCPAGRHAQALAAHIPGCAHRRRTVAFSQLEEELYPGAAR
jgi:hypothetical protein